MFFFSEEIKNCVHTFKCKIISIKKALSFNKNKTIFSSFINYFHPQKVSNNLKINKKAFNYFYKLILNSLYGRFSMKYSFEYLAVVKDKLLPKLSYTLSVKSLKKLNSSNVTNYNLVTFSTYPSFLKKDIKTNYSNQIFNLNDITDNFFVKDSITHISSAVAAYGRAILLNTIHTHCLEKNTIVYQCDTDSIYTNKVLNTNWCNPKILGKFKKKNLFLLKGFFLSSKTFLIKELNFIFSVRYFP